MEQEKQYLAQELANRKLIKLNIIESVLKVFDKYEELLQGFLELKSENEQLKKLLVDKEKEPMPVEKEPVSVEKEPMPVEK